MMYNDNLWNANDGQRRYLNDKQQDWFFFGRGTIIVVYVCQCLASSNLNKCCSSSLFLWSDGIKQLITIKYRWNVLYSIGICIMWALMVIDRCSLYLFSIFPLFILSFIVFLFLNELLMWWTSQAGNEHERGRKRGT